MLLVTAVFMQTHFPVELILLMIEWYMEYVYTWCASVEVLNEENET